MTRQGPCAYSRPLTVKQATENYFSKITYLFIVMRTVDVTLIILIEIIAYVCTCMYVLASVSQVPYTWFIWR